MLFNIDSIETHENAFSIRLDKLLNQKRMTLKAKYPMIDTFPHGAPLGGFGAGTFSRTPDGSFSIWHLFPGIHIVENVKGCNFAVYQKYKNKRTAVALNNNKKNVFTSWDALQHTKGTSYSALYPKSWYGYNDLAVDVSIEQFSPVLPDNYEETSLPVACFNVQLENKEKEEMEVSFLFSFQNILGWSVQETAESFEHKHVFYRQKISRQNKRIEEYEMKGILFSGKALRQGELSGQLCLLAREPEGAKMYFCTTYNGEGDGDEVWDKFSEDGTLIDSNRSYLDSQAGAIAIKATLVPGQIVEIPIVLSWDIPKALDYYKYYTRYYNKDGNNAFQIAKDVLKNFTKISNKINDWHDEIAKKEGMPSKLKTLLFNELYYLADGGSLWDAQTGRFAHLECYDYLFYETLDVRFFGAFPLAIFWPKIEKTIMLDFARTIFEEDKTEIAFHESLSVDDAESVAGDKQSKFIQKDARKRKFTVPHDIGSPFEKVWKKLNAYTWQNSNRWKDLNSKFVLMIYRAYYYDGKKDKRFLAKTWAGIEAVLNYHNRALDQDGDFLPENENFPDQTFDNWKMKGSSAYCGVLKLAAMRVAIQIAEILDKRKEALEIRRKLRTATDSLYAKLWNGEYFNFDESSNDIMTAQLAGQWYLDQMHLPAVIDENTTKKILKKIYQVNFKNYAKGKVGVVNGRTINGEPVLCEQGNDVWVGVNFAFVAQLVQHGFKKEARKIIDVIYKQIYEKGFLFRTPESWDEDDQFIATMYMRPGAVWALYDFYK